MLILTPTQVSACQLNQGTAEQPHLVPGVRYNGRFFVEGKTFATEARDAAIAYSRQAFLQAQGEQMFLLIEHEENLTVWQENKLAQLAAGTVGEAAKDRDPVWQINIKDMVSKMRDVGGVKIKDRVYRLKTYPRCFIGSEAVQWFMRVYKLDQAAAIRLGQRLVSEHWIHHVTDDHTFKNEQLFYRFYWDEK